MYLSLTVEQDGTSTVCVLARLLLDLSEEVYSCETCSVHRTLLA